MNANAPGTAKDGVILLTRFLLFLIFGWNKLTDYHGTVAYMQATGAPVPALSAVIAIVMEFLVGLSLLLGLFTRPLAVLLALYTLATAYLGHHYWTMAGTARFEAEINFFKNISITGGLLLLYVTGPGKYALDTMFRRD